MKNKVRSIYKNREEFIVLGLTGKTGSGCSTVADILKNGYKEYNPVDCTLANIQSRKAEIIKKFEKEEINLVNQIITSKKTIGLKEIKKLFDDIKNYANKKSIQNDLIFYILKKIYIDSNPKSPLKYFLYRKATKNSNKKFKEELNMFLKSFIIFNRDSKIYQLLKNLKKMLKI